MLKKNATILFQGDSVTDCSRNREVPTDLGLGYPRLVAGALTVLRPYQNYTVLNRGVGGDKSCQLLERWDADCIDIKPDMLSILVGINDLWHAQQNNGTTAEEFTDYYDKLLTKTREKLGDIPIVLCEPFLLPHANIPVISRDKLAARIDIVRAMAAKYDTTLIALDGTFAEYSRIIPSQELSVDGVHPTPKGHGIIAKKWLDATLNVIL